MNREIKFRAWYDIAGEWRYFTFNQPLTDIARAVHQNICINGGIFYQFTGLKDKNGKDIYEGDIIDLHQTINGVSKFSVEWSQKRMGWTLRYAENMKNPRTYEYDVADVFTVEEIEVIGNIHENPAQ